MELKYLIETLVPIPAYQTKRCGQTCLQDVVPQSDSGGDNGKKLPQRACYRQAATPVGTFTLPLPSTTTVGINLQVLQNSQNCITGRGGGRWSPPTQQARPVPSLQTALPYLVKGGAQQNKFRSSLLSRYERFTKEITPPPSMFFSNVSANADHPCNFTSYIHPSRLSRRPTEWIHATYMSYGT